MLSSFSHAKLSVSRIAAEVQLIYEPYMTEGRELSHIPYKIYRSNQWHELLADAATPLLSEKLQHAQEACAKVVEEARLCWAPFMNHARPREDGGLDTDGPVAGPFICPLVFRSCCPRPLGSVCLSVPWSVCSVHVPPRPF